MNTDIGDDDSTVSVDDLHVGLTRSATMWGVPLKPLLFSMVAVAAVFTASGKLFTLLAALPAFGVLRLLSASNPRIFAELAAWSRVHMRCNNRLFWGAASFSPRRINKWKKRP